MIPPCADDVMIGTCWPDGDSGLTVDGFGEGGGGTPRRARGMYGVYVVCGAAEGCRGGGRTGPDRGGGEVGAASSGDSVPFGIVGVLGGDRNVVDEDGLPDPEGEAFPLGNLSG